MSVVLLSLCLLADAPMAEGGPPAPAAASDRVFSGTVVEADGRPAADADVWLVGLSLRREPEVQAHGHTDGQGRFRLPVPERWFARAGWTDERAVCAWKPGARLAVFQARERTIPPADRVRLVLQPAETTVLTVRTPEGLAAADARVLLAGVHIVEEGGLRLSLPDELSERLACRTDAEGRAEFTAVPADQIGKLALESQRFGRQVLLRPPDAGWTAPLDFWAVGHLAGRLVAQDAKLASGCEITVYTYRFDESGIHTQMGTARVTTDGEGRFEIPAIMHGPLLTLVSLPQELPYRARTTQSRHEMLSEATDWAVAGEFTEIDIPLEPAVRATGVVRERGTGRPVSKATVHVASAAGWHQFATTDEKGEYECYVLPPGVRAVAAVPLRFSLPQIVTEPGDQEFTIVPEGAEAVELPPIELAPAPTLRGTVVDDQNRPVSDASVSGIVFRGGEAPLDIEVETDAEGAFLIEGLNPQWGALLFASHEDRASDGPTMRNVADADAVTLAISEANRIMLSGRVLDAGGAPVADAVVEIRHRRYLPVPGQEAGDIEQPIHFEEAVVTDSEGRFRTPRTLHKFGFYQAEVSGVGLRTEHTRWLPVLQTSEFEDVTVARLLAVAGRVMDGGKRPVAGATVTLDDLRQRTTATTDESGTFRFSDAPGGLAFVLVSKPGFRTTGRRIDPPVGRRESGRQAAAPEGQEIELILSREDDAPADPSLNGPQPLTAEVRRELVKRLLAPVTGRETQVEDGEMMRAYQVLAIVDPEGTLERIEAEPFAEAMMNSAVRTAAAEQLLKVSLEDGLAVAESIEPSMWRIKISLDACDLLPDSDRRQKLDHLSHALLLARGERNPPFRVLMLAQIGARLWELGEVEMGTGVLREGEQAAQELARDAFAGYARGAFAEDLARIDLEAALELIEDLNDPDERDRHYGNMAHKLAAQQPAEAQRVLDLVRPEGERRLIPPRDQYRVRVCYRMAPVDRERARRIADEAQDRFHRAYAYGMMAWSLAETDSPTATELLREAFVILHAIVNDGQDAFNHLFSAASVAASLLPAAERIDPRLVPEFLWRAVSLRLVPDDDPMQVDLADQSHAVLATFLARYDRSTAEALLASAGHEARITDPWLKGMALVDPHRAVEHVQRLDQGLDRTLRERLIVAGVIARDGEDLWREIIRRTALWPPDVEDLF